MNAKGFSLIESLLVIATAGAIAFLLASIPNALMLYSKSRHLSLATEIALKQIEDKRTLNFENLVNDNSPVSDSRISLLPDGSGQISVTDCPPQICTSGENTREVTARVSWQENNKPQEVILKTLISEGGINQ